MRTRGSRVIDGLGDAAVGAVAVVAGVLAGIAYVAAFVEVDDGLEGLVTLPVSAAMVGVLGAVRLRRAPVLVASAAWVALGGTAAWTVTGALSLLGDDAVGPVGGAAAGGFIGGSFVLAGTGVAFGLAALGRRVAREVGETVAVRAGRQP